jgi:hypothetical protein
VPPSAEPHISRLCSAKRCGCECRRTCAVASLDLVLDGKALWRIAKDYRRVGDHQAPAIALRMRDVDRTPRWLATPRRFTFQPQREERNDQRA